MVASVVVVNSGSGSGSSSSRSIASFHAGTSFGAGFFLRTRHLQTVAASLFLRPLGALLPAAVSAHLISPSTTASVNELSAGDKMHTPKTLAVALLVLAAKVESGGAASHAASALNFPT